MAERDEVKKPLSEGIERIGERIRDFVDGVVGALEDAFAPPPEPIRVPVRRYPPYGRRR